MQSTQRDVSGNNVKHMLHKMTLDPVFVLVDCPAGVTCVGADISNWLFTREPQHLFRKMCICLSDETMIHPCRD